MSRIHFFKEFGEFIQSMDHSVRVSYLHKMFGRKARIYAYGEHTGGEGGLYAAGGILHHRALLGSAAYKSGPGEIDLGIGLLVLYAVAGDDGMENVLRNTHGPQIMDYFSFVCRCTDSDFKAEIPQLEENRRDFRRYKGFRLDREEHTSELQSRI